MQAIAMLHRIGALCVIVLCLLPGGGRLLAQPTAPPAPPNAAKPEEVSPAELLASYQHMQEQLHLTQAAILKNRLDAEAAAIAQRFAFAQKLDNVVGLMAAENLRQQATADRLEYERAVQEREMKQVHHTVLWVAGAFGGIGLLALFLAARLQRRTFRRLTDAGELRPPLPAPTQSDLLLTGSGQTSGQTVTLANQRVMSVINRMERRIFELENSAHPLPVAKTEPVAPPLPN